MGDITQLLHQWRDGSREAENQLFVLVLPDLKRLARHFMRKERRNHSLQATDLIDTVYFRMVAAKDRDWRNRKHFFALSARAMRRHLIDHARKRRRAEFVAMDGWEQILPADSRKIDVAISVDGLLEELAKSEPEWSMLVEMKYFLGLTDEEAADAMGMTLRTMQRMWHNARKWLFTRLESANAQSAG